MYHVPLLLCTRVDTYEDLRNKIISVPSIYFHIAKCLIVKFIVLYIILRLPKIEADRPLCVESRRGTEQLRRLRRTQAASADNRESITILEFTLVVPTLKRLRNG